MDIPINIFRGLYTNVDPADQEPTYFTRFKNVKVYPGYLKSEGYNLTQTNWNLPAGHMMVYYDFVFLDGDKHQNELQDLKLVNIYKQDLKKYEFLITYKEGLYFFWLRLYETISWIPVKGPLGTIAGVPGQIPIVDNTEPVLKVFMEERAVWIGNINRKYWSWVNTTKTIENDYYAYPLIEPYSNAGISGPFHFTIETDTTIAQSKVAVRGEIVDLNFKFNHSGVGKVLNTVAIKLTDAVGRTIPFSNYSGYLILGKVLVQGANPGEFYAFWRGHNDIVPHPPGQVIIDRWGVQQVALWKVWDNNEVGLWPSNSFGFPKGWVLLDDINNIQDWIGEGTNTYPLWVDLREINLQASFDAGRDIQILTTVRVNDNEYPVKLDELGDSDVAYIIKAEPASDLDDFYQNKVAINLYFRHSSSINEVEMSDFELCYTIPMVSGGQLVMPLYINKLTPNGIFLTQTIGKFFDKNTYDIIDNPSDYISMGGISYILKNGNLHYPAVGGGTILNNTFYPENYVPGVTGDFLVGYANTLGVFKKDVELLTLIDFQPVEGTMLFYIKDEIGYKLNKYEDLIDTADGSFLFVREGIYLINQYDRQWLSEEINDIVERAYDNGSGRIFYNAYEKELYFLTSFGYYVLRFKTKSWSEFTLESNVYIAFPANNIEVPLTDPIVDVVDDYAGNTYFLTLTKRYKLVTGHPARSSVKTMQIGRAELKIKKVLEVVRYDMLGKLYYENMDVKENTLRNVIKVFNPVQKRIAKDTVEIGFDFEGELYGLQITMEGALIERV